MVGYGPVTDSALQAGGPSGDCPNALPDHMTVNSAGDIQLAGVHLANFLEHLRRHYGVRKIHLVAHSMGGLYSRAAIQYLKQTRSRISVLSLTTLGTPWQGTSFADPIDLNDPYSGCDGQKICEQILNDFSSVAPVVRVDINPAQMNILNEYSKGLLKNIPVTLIGGNAFIKSGGRPSVWPNDGVVNLESALAQNLSDQVIDHRHCYLYEGGTHSVWVSNNADPKLPEDMAITWSKTVGNWVDEAIRSYKTAMEQPNRLGCPVPG